MGKPIKNDEKSWFFRFQKSMQNGLRNGRGSFLGIREHSLGIPESILENHFFIKNDPSLGGQKNTIGYRANGRYIAKKFRRKNSSMIS